MLFLRINKPKIREAIRRWTAFKRRQKGETSNITKVLIKRTAIIFRRQARWLLGHNCKRLNRSIEPGSRACKRGEAVLIRALLLITWVSQITARKTESSPESCRPDHGQAPMFVLEASGQWVKAPTSGRSPESWQSRTSERGMNSIIDRYRPMRP